MQNDVLVLDQDWGPTAEAIAARTAASRGTAYLDEVRRLLSAGLEVMRRLGTDAAPRVADVVAEAGLSNDAFYRHFSGKEEFVTAIINTSAERLEQYLHQQMDAEADPAQRIRRWIEAMMQHAVDPSMADTVRVLIWNGHRVGADTHRTGASRDRLAGMLIGPVAALGSTDPARDALLICYACMLRMEEFLWRREPPTQLDVDHAVSFCLRSIGAGE